MAKYAIEDTTLTAIGDAIREHTGKHTREEILPVTDNYYSFSIDTNNPDDYANFVQSPTQSYFNIYKHYYHYKGAKKYKLVYSGEIVQQSGLPTIYMESVEVSPALMDSDDIMSVDTFTIHHLNCTSGETIFDTRDGQYPRLSFLFKHQHAYEHTKINMNFEIYGLDENGNVISEETIIVKDTMTPGEMIEEINGLNTIPEEALTITGDCKYRFAHGGWDWFINKHGDKITTTDISYANYMFYNNQSIEELPFSLNFRAGGGTVNYMFGNSYFKKIDSIDFKQTSYYDCTHLFDGCSYLTEIGTLKNLYPSNIDSLFQTCYRLRYLPEFEGINFSRLQSYSIANMSSIFQNCYSLRSIPESFLKELYGIQTSYTYVLSYRGFNACYALDEIRGFMPGRGALTSNGFRNTFDECYRLKDIIFAIQEDGTPYNANWKSQTIDLTINVGYAPRRDDIVFNFNSGITADKEVTDDATYQALKDDPDWFTCDINYSRYNHDSAVNTINSLPIITASGTNTIKFKGAAGALTNGGAINTLTEEEIAVAAAKGWTVALS